MTIAITPAMFLYAFVQLETRGYSVSGHCAKFAHVDKHNPVIAVNLALENM